MSDKMIYVSRDAGRHSGYYVLNPTKPEPDAAPGTWRCKPGHHVMFADEFEKLFGLALEPGCMSRVKVSLELVGEGTA